MKIVMLTELYGDNLQYQENLLGKYYVKHGHKVTVIAGTSNDAIAFYSDKHDPCAPAREYRDGHVKVIKLPYSLNFLSRLRRFGGVAGILDREQPDLIFVHDIHLNLAEAAAYKRKHPACRIIMDYHADYTNSAKNWVSLNILHKVIRKRFLYRYLRYIDKILPVVPISFVFLNEVYGIPYEEMELLPLGADTDLAQHMRLTNAGTAVRTALGIPKDAITIFTGGKLRPLKQTHLLLEAFVRLADPKLHVIIVGEGDEGQDEYKRQLLAQCAGNARAHFVGWVHGDDVYKYMDACDFAVFPGSQSVLWQQSLSMGLPLIVAKTTHRGNQDPSYMNLYGNVIILSAADIRSDVLAAKISELVGDHARLSELQAAALKATDDLLNYDKIIQKTLTFA